jgi:two-component system, chemotaxis family, chemotaxis protein CheY
MMVSTIRALVVEDSATMRAFVVAALEDAGFEVTQAKSGFEALKILPKERFNIIVTDVNMPDINGLELVRYVRNSPDHKPTPLIIISTDGRERDRDRGMHLGATAYLVKPFKPEELIKKAREVLTPGYNVAPLIQQPPPKK